MNSPAILRLRHYLRITPFNLDTEEGRTAERYRRAALSAVADVCAKLCGMGLLFLGVSLTLPYLGAERFGIWVTLTSLTAMLSLLDLGIGAALINRVAHATTQSENAAVLRVASGGLGTMVILGTLIGVALTLSAAVLPWQTIVRLRDPENYREVRDAAMIFGALFGCNIIASGVRSIYIGLQRSYIAHAGSALGYLAAILALLCAAKAHAQVPVLLLVTFGMQIIFGILLVGIAWRYGVIKWPRMSVVLGEASSLLRVGSLFFLLQIGMMIGFAGDSLLIAHIRGAQDVTELNVVLRLFQLIALPLAIISAPLWGAYAEAKARNDGTFIRKTLQANFFVVFSLGSAGTAIIAAAAQFAIPWWTKGAVNVEQSLINALAIWTLVQGLGAALGAFLNGMAIVAPQIIAVSTFVIIGLPLKWLVLEHYSLTAFVLASVTAYLVTHLSVYGLLYYRYLRRSSKNIAPVHEPRRNLVGGSPE